MQKEIDAATREKYHLYSAQQDTHFKQKMYAYIASEDTTAVALSRKCDFAPGAINAMLHNEQFIRRNHVSRIVKVTGMTEEELMGPETACVLECVSDTTSVDAASDHAERCPADRFMILYAALPQEHQAELVSIVKQFCILMQTT